MTIPNMLTFLRFFLAPLLLVVYLASGEGGFLEAALSPRVAYAICLVMVLVSEASDLLDGFLARRWGQVSNLGKILDPYADSTFHLTCFFAFSTRAHGGWIPLWMVMILFYREVLIHVIRKLGVERGVYISARTSGKFKTFCQATTVIILLGYGVVTGPATAGTGLPPLGSVDLPLWLFAGVVTVTAFSAVDYTWANRKVFGPAEGGKGPGKAG